MNDPRSSHFPIIGHGMRTRDSFFSDFFDKDPFDDPFFRRPFGSMFPPMNEFIEPLQQRNQARLTDRLRQQPQGSRGLVIEELSDDHVDAAGGQSRSGSEPIVEHPDDIPLPRTKRDGSQTFSQSFSFSSVMYGGPQGSFYKSSTVRRGGADGLYEEVHEEKDSINGLETDQVLRGLGNKGHAVTRKKNVSGADDYVETLHNLTEDEKTGFDDTWRKQASKYLPGHGKSKGILWKNKRSDNKDGEEEQVAASSSEKPRKQLTWRWPWAKKA